MENSKLKLGKFLNACIAARDVRPNMTIAGLHMFLTIAAHGKPIGYADLSEILETPYKQTAIRIALFADGRGDQPGTFLIDRVQGGDRKEKLIVLTSRGREIAALFQDYMDGARCNETPIFKAFSRVAREYPEMSVNNWAIFLSVHVLQDEIAAKKRQSLIAEHLRLGNLPRNIEKLTSAEVGLLSITKTRQDRRVNILSLSEKGKILLDEIEETLFGPAWDAEDPMTENADEDGMDYSF